MRKIVVLFAMCAVFSYQAASGQDSSQLFQAVRTGDIAFLKSHISKDTLQARDARGATLLMHATAFGNLETVRLLLEAGADVNAHNDFDATALLWGARDPEKARLLIDRGANVNARSKQGRTPLMLASLRRGGSETVARMLEKGAGVNVQDKRGDSALGLAALVGDAESMRLLLAKGADPRVLNGFGESPLILATKSRRADAVQLLLQKHVDVNVANTGSTVVRHGPLDAIRMTALHRAAAFGPSAMVRDLVRAGANVNARDSRGMTPLFFAVATDYPDPEILRLLIAAGADPNLRDNTGETPLDWAEKFGDPGVLAVLKSAGAKRAATYSAPKLADIPRPKPAAAVARSLELLQKSSAEFFNQSGCVGCHHQPLIARAQHAAKAAGISIDENQARNQLAQMRAQWLSSQEEFLQSMNPGGGSNRLAENLLGLQAAGYKPDAITDSAVVDLAEDQTAEGAWPAGEEQPRPPLTESLIASTARSLRAVQAYSIPARKAEFDQRIARARAWLKRAKPMVTEDFALQLLGLAWAGTPVAELRESAQALLALQQKDGGWSANPHLASDPYSTATALTALHDAAVVSPSDAAYRRGVDFLLRTQYADGSWYVRSRSIKFQPYFQSGFPYDHDQWISTAATAWAVQALAPAARARDAAAQATPGQP